MTFNLRWLGTSCFQLVLPGDVHILLDPHMDHSPNSPLTSDQIDRCDYMFLTHGHWDHVLDVGKLAERLRPPIFCNQETATAIVKHQRVDKTLINIVTAADIIERPAVITEVLPGVHVNAAREYKRQTGMDLPGEESFADPLERLRAIMRETNGTDQFPDAYPQWRKIYRGGEQLNFVFEGSDGQRLYVAGTYPDPSVVATAEKVRASVTLLQCLSANKLAGIEQETADLAIASVSAASWMIPRLSRSHCTAAPAMAMDPSRAYTAGASASLYPSVVRSPCLEGIARVPVFSSMKQPVP